MVEENRVLREQLGDRRLRLTDDQRHRLAAKGKVLGWRLLHRVATIVTPDTIMRWHRRLIAAKWTHPSKRIGRPGIMKAIRDLIVRMATDNAGWGYCRIQGKLKKLDHRVARSTIAKTLRAHGIRPAPELPASWRTFLRAHAGAASPSNSDGSSQPGSSMPASVGERAGAVVHVEARGDRDDERPATSRDRRRPGRNQPDTVRSPNDLVGLFDSAPSFVGDP